MNTPTAARIRTEDSTHWYRQDGQPMHKVDKADGKGTRPTTLRDARKLSLVPSVTNILRILHKEALVAWRIEQAVLAVMTSPRVEGESDDAFVQRILHGERVQDEESAKARDRGTAIHSAIEDLFNGKPVDPELLPWIQPAYDHVAAMGSWLGSELSMACDSFGGQIDLSQWTDASEYILTDFKTTKKLPERGAWDEHVLQLSAYAHIWDETMNKDNRPILTQNVYISTQDCGKFCVWQHPAHWKETFIRGFLPLVKHWQWANNYEPTLVGTSADTTPSRAG